MLGGSGGGGWNKPPWFSVLYLRSRIRHDITQNPRPAMCQAVQRQAEVITAQ